MSVELLLLLLPLAVVSGWWAGRSSLGTSKENILPDLSSHYFQGLNYLLNEQPDKAIEVFIKVLEVDSETIETHFTLGNLFRRRGEVDRAIRVHQNLIARPTLSLEHKTQALYELGLDYMRAGILGSAEGLFLELVEDKSKNIQALRQLIDIYQQEKDWDKAIDIVKKYEASTGSDRADVIAHYYCELAEEARLSGAYDQARKMVKRALSNDLNCVRASLIEGVIASEKGDYRAAIRAYQRVERQSPDYLPEVIEPLLECYREAGKVDESMDYFQRILAEHGGITAMLVVADMIKQRHGDQQAVDFIARQLQSRPSVRGLNRLIELSLSSGEGSARDNLVLLRNMTTELLEDKDIYKCNQCGFSGKSMHWQCPGCKSWGSVKPIQGVEGE